MDIQSLLYSSCTSSSVADFQTALVKKYCFKMIQCHEGLAEAYIKDMDNRQQVEVTVRAKFLMLSHLSFRFLPVFAKYL